MIRAASSLSGAWRNSRFKLGFFDLSGSLSSRFGNVRPEGSTNGVLRSLIRFPRIGVSTVTANASNPASIREAN